MRLVPEPLIGEQRCAVTQRAQDRRGFIHTGQALIGMDQEVFISAAAAEEMGRLVGMVPEKDVDALKERVERWEVEAAELRQKLDALANADRILSEVRAA